MSLPKAYGLAAGWPFGSGQGAAIPPTLVDLTLSPLIATAGGAYAGTITGKTAGSVIAYAAADGTAMNVSGTTVTATFANAGNISVTGTETLAGATNTPKVSPSQTMVVSASQYVAFPAMTTFVGLGDSYTAGLNASPIGNSWFNLLAASQSATGLNQGVGGTEVQNSLVSGAPLGQNMRDRCVVDCTGGNKRQKFIFFGGRNDVFELQTATFNVTAFAEDYRQILNLMRIAGYAPTDCILMGLCWQPDAAFTQDPDNPTRANYLQYDAAIRAIAIEYGTYYCDVYAYMRDNGGDALIDTDNIHPTNAGHAVIHQALLTTLQRPNAATFSTVTASSASNNNLTYAATAVPGAVTYITEQSSIPSVYEGTVTGAASGAYTLDAMTYYVRSRADLGGGNYSPWAFSSSQIVAGLWTATVMRAGGELGAWFDGTLPSSITTATGVSQWTSRAQKLDLAPGSTVVAAQATGGLQPAQGASAALGGLNVITATGTQKLTLSQNAIDMGVRGLAGIIMSVSPGTPSGAGTLAVNFGTGATIAGLPTTGGALAEVTWTNAGTTGTYYSAGNSIGTGTLGATPTAAGWAMALLEEPTSLNGRLIEYTTTPTLLNRAAGDRPEGAGVCQILFGANLTLSTSRRQLLEGWLLWKAGLQAQLPVGHPYAAAPPTYPAVAWRDRGQVVARAFAPTDGTPVANGSSYTGVYEQNRLYPVVAASALSLVYHNIRQDAPGYQPYSVKASMFTGAGTDQSAYGTVTGYTVTTWAGGTDSGRQSPNLATGTYLESQQSALAVTAGQLLMVRNQVTYTAAPTNWPRTAITKYVGDEVRNVAASYPDRINSVIDWAGGYYSVDGGSFGWFAPSLVLGTTATRLARVAMARDSFGDGSLDSDAGIAKYAGWPQKLLGSNYPWYFFGAGGMTLDGLMTTSGTLTRFLQMLDLGGFTHVICELCTNDIGVGRTSAQIIAQLATLKAAVEALPLQPRLIPVTPPPRTDAGNTTPINWTQAKLYDAAIRSSNGVGYGFVDQATMFVGGTINTSGLWDTTGGKGTTDGVHPNKASHDAVVTANVAVLPTLLSVGHYT